MCGQSVNQLLSSNFFNYNHVWSSPSLHILVGQSSSVHIGLIQKLVTIFTWLNATATITLVPKIDVATVLTQPPFDKRKRCLSHYFHNQLWAPLSTVTIQGAASNQDINIILDHVISTHCWVICCIFTVFRSIS